MKIGTYQREFDDPRPPDALIPRIMGALNSGLVHTLNYQPERHPAGIAYIRRYTPGILLVFFPFSLLYKKELRVDIDVRPVGEGSRVSMVGTIDHRAVDLLERIAGATAT